MRLPITLVVLFATLFTLYNNCSIQNFKSTSWSSSDDGYGLSKMQCFDRNQRAANYIYALSAQEYINIAEDLFPSAKLSDLVSQTSSLPITPDQF